MQIRTGATVGLSAAWLAGQWWQTFRGQNRWPLTSYDMFNYTVPELCPELRVVLVDDAGHSSQPLDPWGLLPLDFFRVVSVLESVLLTEGVSENRKDALCQLILDELNERPWRAHDEVRAAFRPPAGRRFTSLSFWLVEVHDGCDARQRDQVASAELVRGYPAAPAVDPIWEIRSMEPA